LQKFSMESTKYCGVIQPITATSMGQATRQEPETQFFEFGKVMEDIPEKRIQRNCTNEKDIVTI